LQQELGRSMWRGTQTDRQTASCNDETNRRFSKLCEGAYNRKLWLVGGILLIVRFFLLIWEMMQVVCAFFFTSCRQMPWQYFKLSHDNILPLFFRGAKSLGGPEPPYYRVFTITLRHNTLGRTPLDEWSVRRRDLYLTKHNTHKMQTSIPPAWFEPTISAN
jgi:hypothetical protein